MKLEGLDRLNAKMRALTDAKRREAGVSVILANTAQYALVVHERRDVFHPVGRAGFLLDVAREEMRQIGDVVTSAAKAGRSVEQSLLLGVLYLQSRVVPETPILTGNLRGSFVVRVER